MKQIFTVGDLLHLIKKNYNNPKAIGTYRDATWHTLNTDEFISEVRHLALGLIASGVKRGEMIGILALPCHRWTIADLAIMAAGAISIPLFANISDDNFHFEVQQTEMKRVFVGEKDQWTRYELTKDLFDEAISLDEKPGVAGVTRYEDLLAKGKAYDEAHPGFYEQQLQSITPDTIGTIIYTSGSTGVPKGAVHTHHSLFSLLNCPVFHWNSTQDVYLSFLPLAHVFARVLNLIMVSWGISIYYFNDVKNIAAACQEIRPSVMVVVPRLLEKMYAKMAEKAESGSGLKKWIATTAFKLANLQNPNFFQRLLHPLFDALVYKKLRAALGGRLRVVFSGGAALNPRLYQFYLNAGFPFYEGWGLTESCPITVNRIEKIKVGTVGPALPGMKVTCSQEGELLVKGEMMMNGYFKNKELTDAIFDKNGWLKTGDKGFIDEEGFVTIEGRFKELLKTSTGEMIAPVPIEQSLSKAPFVDTAMVIGDNRKYAACLLVPDFEYLQKIKEKTHQTHLSDKEFLNSPYMINEVDQLLKKVNEKLNSWEQVHNYRFIPEPLTIDGGELTPSMKIKRDVIEKKYQQLIDTIYSEEQG